MYDDYQIWSGGDLGENRQRLFAQSGLYVVLTNFQHRCHIKRREKIVLEKVNKDCQTIRVKSTT